MRSKPCSLNRRRAVSAINCRVRCFLRSRKPIDWGARSTVSMSRILPYELFVAPSVWQLLTWGNSSELEHEAEEVCREAPTKIGLPQRCRLAARRRWHRHSDL